MVVPPSSVNRRQRARSARQQAEGRSQGTGYSGHARPSTANHCVFSELDGMGELRSGQLAVHWRPPLQRRRYSAEVFPCVPLQQPSRVWRSCAAPSPSPWPATARTPSATPTPTPTNPVAQSITVNGTLSLRQPGDTGQLTAIATLSDGTTRDVTALAGWSGGTRVGDNTRVVSVTQAGLLTAVDFGQTTIVVGYYPASVTVPVRVVAGWRVSGGRHGDRRRAKGGIGLTSRRPRRWAPTARRRARQVSLFCPALAR